MRSGDAADLDFFDEPGGILAGLAIIATAMLLFLVVWPVIAIAVELTLLALVLVAAVAGRVLLRRPWTVFARSEGAGPAQEHTWQVVGWRRSDRLIEDVIRSLEKGTSCPPGAQTVGPSPRALPGPRDGAT
jgi:hypothetical protein